MNHPVSLTDKQQAALYFARKRRRMASAKIWPAAPLSVEEGSEDGTSVGFIRLVPKFGISSFELTDDAEGRFAIDAGTGELTVADGESLVYDDNQSHDIEVTARDGFGNTFVQSLTVEVTEA
jgi:hypothetical protein